MTLLYFFVLTGLFENYLQVKFKDPSFEVVSQKINCLKEMFNHPQHYHIWYDVHAQLIQLL